MFSAADWYKDEKSNPFLAKYVNGILNEKKFKLAKILLIYGMKENHSEDEIRESLEKTLIHCVSSTEERIKDYFKKPKIRFFSSNEDDFSSKEDGLYIWINRNKDNSVQNFYNLFYKICEGSGEKIFLLNMVSGNIQSREALQYLEFGFGDPKLKFHYFFQSQENNSATKHKTDIGALNFAKNKNFTIPIESDYSNFKLRVKEKNTRAMSNNAVMFSVNNYLKSGKYQEAYTVLEFHKGLFKEGIIELYEKCFSDEVKLPIEEEYFEYVLTAKEFSEYFLYRLMYLDQSRASKESCRVIYNLLWTIYNLKCSKEVKNNGDGKYRFPIGFYEKLNNGNRNDFSFIRISSKQFHSQNYKSFFDLYNSLRHFKDPKFRSFDDKEQAKIYNDTREFLKDVFFDDYIRYTDFSNCESFNMLKSEVKDKLKLTEESFSGYIETRNESGKKDICFLSCMGSTDPGNIWEDTKNNTKYFMFGSSLCFCKAVDLSDEEDFKELRKWKRKNKFSYYFLCTKEISDTFKENQIHLTDLESESFYNNQIHLLPFKENPNFSDSYDFENLYQDESGEKSIYDFENSYRICKMIVDKLLLQFSKIYILESSGIPVIKMCWSFLSMQYQNRLIIYECIGPKEAYGKDFEQVSSKENNQIQPNNQNCVSVKEEGLHFNTENKYNILNMVTIESLSPMYLEQFLTQKLSYENLMKKLELEGKKIPQFDYSKINDLLIKVLLKTHYQIEFGEEKNAIMEMDFCFEEMASRIKNYFDDLKFENHDDAKQFYAEWKEKKRFSMDNSTYYFIKNCYQENPEDIEFNGITRMSGSILFCIYCYIHDFNEQKTKKLLLHVNEIWKKVSFIKHPSESENWKNENAPIFTNNILEEFIDNLVFKDVQSDYRNALEMYENIKKKVRNSYSGFKNNLSVN